MGFSIRGNVCIKGTKDQLKKAREFICCKYPSLEHKDLCKKGAKSINVNFNDTWADLYDYCRFIIRIKKEIPELYIKSKATSFYSVVCETSDISETLPSNYC